MKPPTVSEVQALLAGLDVGLLVVEEATGSFRFEGTLPQWLDGLELDRPFFTLVSQADQPQLRRALKDLSTTPRTLEHGLWVGSLELHVRTSLTRASEPGRVLVALHDVTAARHDARQWRELESWLATMAETLPFDFFILDRDGRFLLQNPASVRRFGAAFGRTFYELALPDAMKESFLRAASRALDGEQVREERSWVVDGVERTFSQSMSPVRDGDIIVGVLGIDIDITPLKQSEAALRQSLSELEATQGALVRRKQFAALGEMAAVVAHEVRNPLGSIANAISLMQRGMVAADELPQLWRVIADETRRLDLLVADLLDFVRPVTLTLSPRPLEPLLARALRQTLWTEDAADEVATQLEGSAPPVPLDDRQLELAFTNLFRNAVQAMNGRGALFVSISTEADDQQRWARVTIRDTGPGMPLEVTERIFEPFVTTRASGHGLGLAIVRKVVEQHRGDVRFESVPGQGTTCVVRLPVGD